jgi:hypothetical protein
MVYVIQVCWQLASCQQTCMTCTIAVCTVKNSWWWAEELSETCRISFQNKFEKFVHLVGFIIRNQKEVGQYHVCPESTCPSTTSYSQIKRIQKSTTNTTMWGQPIYISQFISVRTLGYSWTVLAFGLKSKSWPSVCVRSGGQLERSLSSKYCTAATKGNPSSRWCGWQRPNFSPYVNGSISLSTGPKRSSLEKVITWLQTLTFV